ncbi:MAG: TIGR04013 family B12-binding domain/radical SAM domain-containing protein [Planctomycetes bacterium]|nr:TIGR04013 family B12-binding domain/radical SAM domain-containing protein [Planctomycetota bacterium]
MTATLITSYRSPGKYALNVLAGAFDAVEDEGGVRLVIARSREALLESTRSSVEAGQPTCVAWSFYSPSFPACADELAWLRERVPSGWTALAGGVHASAEPEQVLRAGFDFAAVGEGEHTVRAIARALRDGRPLAEVRGLARLERGALAQEGRGVVVEHLDEFPAFSARRRMWGAIEITRGCVYACKFCQTPFLNKARFRHRSPANVAHHAGQIRAAGMRDVRFVSPTSLSYGSPDERVDLAAVEELLRAVRAAIGGEGRLYFGTFPSEVRPEHATPEALALLRSFVDNDNLVLGGQSGSERVLRASHRGHDVECIERAVVNCAAAGFTANVDFLLGLPGEEPSDVDATVALMERLMALGARVHGHTFMPLPGTPFRDAPAGALDERTRARLESLEGRGRLYGQWKRQAEIARELVERRPVRRGAR